MMADRPRRRGAGRPSTRRRWRSSTNGFPADDPR